MGKMIRQNHYLGSRNEVRKGLPVKAAPVGRGGGGEGVSPEEENYSLPRPFS